jgi:predicted outer membrane protein
MGSRTGENQTSSDTAMSGMPSDTARTSSAASSGGLTDPNIVALLDEANMADSASRAQGRQLAKRLNVTPQLPSDDPLKPAASSEMAALKAAPKGAQFDRTYIEQEIGIHKAVLDLAGKAHDAAQNGDLKKLIEQAKPVIEKHLNRAEDIQKKLGKASA